MSVQLRILVLAVALAALVALVLLGPSSEPERLGMTEAPCAGDGTPITGETKHDWAGLCAYRHANAELLENGPRPAIVMIGDSITAGWPVPGRAIANRGIGAQTSSQVMLRFQQDALALEPQVIHILVGINDVSGVNGHGSPDVFQNNIRGMVEMAQAHDVDVILGTIGPAQDPESRPQLKRRYWVPRLNKWLVNYAREQGLVVADYHAVLAHPDGRMRSELFGDSVHPNAAGYAEMQKVLIEAVRHTRIANAARSRTAR